jgi:hypothetical protein
MGILNFFPGGDSSLNAVAYSSAANLPASADAGTLAIITSTALGIAYASAEAPASPAAGDIWVQLGTNSVAPVVLTDEITLDPLSVYQYVSSAWVFRISYVYTGSAWKILSTYLYDDGAFILANDIAVVASTNGSLTKNANNIYMSASRGEGVNAYCVAGFDTKINVTNISKIKAYLNHSWTSSGAAILGVSLNKSTTLAASVTSTSSGLQTLSLDVSALTGEYYVMLRVQDYGDWYTADTITVYEVYYEA